MIRKIAVLAALLAAATVGGCAVYEPYPPVGYASQGYYAPAPVYGAPVVVVPGWGGGYGGHHRGWR